LRTPAGAVVGETFERWSIEHSDEALEDDSGHADLPVIEESLLPLTPRSDVAPPFRNRLSSVQTM
jgi:hypothetical protein